MDLEKTQDDEAKAVTPPSLSSDTEAGDSAINERHLLRKLDLAIVPGVTLLYLLSFLDRSNVANAKLDGLTKDLHMTGNQYLTGLTLFFVGYISLEIAWNIVLKLVGPRLWLPTITLIWGIITTLQGLTQNMTGFFIVRTVLGIAEGGLFPGVVFYLSMWYKRSERQYRVALLFSAASLAGAFGGILAYVRLHSSTQGYQLTHIQGIGFMKGVAGYNGWRWIFIIEGIATCVIAVAAYWFIHPWPAESKFLTPAEKAHVHARLAADSDSSDKEPFQWSNVMAAIADPKVWLYALAYHTLSLPLYTLSLFLPSIISALGYSAASAQLLTIPPYVFATGLTILYAVVSEKLTRRAVFIAGSSIFAIVGYAILLSNHDPVKRPGVSYLGTFFAAGGIYPAVALTLSWPAVNVSAQTKRATANALQITIGNLGAVIGTQIYRSQDTPRYVVGHSVALAYLVANVVVVGVLFLVLRGENRRKERLLAEGGQSLAEKENGDRDVRWRFTY